MEPIGAKDLILLNKAVYIKDGKFNVTGNTKRNFYKLNDQTHMYGNKNQQNRIRIKENITIEKNTGTSILDKQKIEQKINAASDNIPIVMKLMLNMMLEERGHNHKEFRESVLNILQDNRYKVEDILSDSFKFKDWKYYGKCGKIKKLWARYLFDTYTMLCTKIVNNFIRYDKSFPEDESYPDLRSIGKKELGEEEELDYKKPYIKKEAFVDGDKYIVKKGLLIHEEKAHRMHVNKLGAIDVLNDKKKIKNILRDFSQGKEYLATRGNGLLGNSVPLLWTSVPLLWTSVPDKVEYGVLINQLNASIKGFASDLLEWCTNENKKSEYLKTIMEKMDEALLNILNGVDVELEKDKRSSTIRQPWNKACNLKKCVQFLYSKCKFGNNVITGQFFSGKNSRSGKKKYRNILNECIENLGKLKAVMR